MAVQNLGRNGPEGVTIGADSTELAGFHGSASAQSATIATTASTLVSLRAKVNLMRLALIAKGIIASA